MPSVEIPILSREGVKYFDYPQGTTRLAAFRARQQEGK
jgi:hypothetical protein